jgi:putative two-component system response regulator
MSTQDVQVLVVDDDPVTRDLVSLWLENEGYTCAVFEDGEAAWEFFQQHEVPLVTLDIGLAGVSGIELLARIRRCSADTEVVVLTAGSEAATAIDALTQGAFAYLIKPVRPEELVLQVRRGLERRRWHRERQDYMERLEQTVCQQTLETQLAQEEIIHRLTMASLYRDEETAAHIRRIGLFSEALALAADWPLGRAEQLRLAAPMHDVGKIGIPDAVLRKPGRLTPAEYELMKTHTTIGARMLGGSRSAVLQTAELIARCHHERWGGSGYPRGLSGTAIPEPARIVAIADVYDALTHDRIYRRALPEDEVLKIMREGRGVQFDPKLLDGFLQVLPDFRRIAAQNPDEPPSEESDLDLILGSSGAVAMEPAAALSGCAG